MNHTRRHLNQTVDLLAGLDRVVHQQRDGHGAHTARHGCDGTTLWRDFVKLHIADQLVALGAAGVFDTVDADINDDRAFLDVLSLDKFRTPNRSDDNVRLAADLDQVLGARVRDGHCGIATLPLAISSRAIGLPTIMLRPTTTTFAPAVSMPAAMSKRWQPSGVQGTKPV